MAIKDYYCVNYVNAILKDKSVSEKIVTLDQIISFSKVLIGHENIWLFLNSPLMSSDEKKGVLVNFSKMLKIDESVLNLFIVLIKNKRLSMLNMLSVFCSKQKDKLNSIKKITLISADKFNIDERNKLIKKLHAIGLNNIDLNETVDPSLILGFKLLTENQVYDLSLKSMIENLKTKISKTN